MLKTIVLSVPILSFILCLTSCKPNPNQKYLNQIDSLELRINIAHKLLQSLDTTQIALQLKNTNKNLSIIQDDLKVRKDTISKELGFLLSDYNANRKSCSSFLTNYKKQMNEYSYSADQLKNLRADFSSNLVPKEKVTEYFKIEGQAIAAYIQSSDNMLEWHKIAIEQYNKKHPEILAYIQSLKDEN